MSRPQDLPPDLHAALSLVLRQDKDYAALAAMLGIEARAVHDRAHAALAMLAPAQGRQLTPAQREQVGEYLLRQASPAQQAEARAYLEGSAPGRAWAQVLAAELAPLAARALPEIPAAPAQTPAPPAPSETPPPGAPSGMPLAGPSSETAPPATLPGTSLAGPSSETTPPATPPQTPPLPPAHPDGAPAAPASRRGGAIVLGGLAVAVIAAVALIVGLSSGGGSTASPPAATGTTTTQTGGTSTTPSNTKSGANGSGSSTSTTSKAGAIHVDATLPLTPPNSSSKALGIVEVASRGGARVFLIAAEHLPPTTGFRYAAWLYNSTANEAFLLGQGPTVGSDGKLTAAGGLPATAAHYSEIILTEETSEKPTHPGSIVLGGAFKLG